MFPLGRGAAVGMFGRSRVGGGVGPGSTPSAPRPLTLVFFTGAETSGSTLSASPSDSAPLTTQTSPDTSTPQTAPPP